VPDKRGKGKTKGGDLTTTVDFKRGGREGVTTDPVSLYHPLHTKRRTVSAQDRSQGHVRGGGKKVVGKGSSSTDVGKDGSRLKRSAGTLVLGSKYDQPKSERGRGTRGGRVRCLLR